MAWLPSNSAWLALRTQRATVATHRRSDVANAAFARDRGRRLTGELYRLIFSRCAEALRLRRAWPRGMGGASRVRSRREGMRGRAVAGLARRAGKGRRRGLRVGGS